MSSLTDVYVFIYQSFENLKFELKNINGFL